MENGTHTGAGVLRPMEFAPGPMGFSRSFAAFSQNILDRYAIWEKYPWSDAVIRYLEQEKQEEASGEKEPSSFFVTLKLLKIYLENEQGKEKAAGEAEETEEAKEAGKTKEAEHETLTLRIEAELRRLEAGYDKYFGILERLYREGRQMPQDERVRIWELLKREAGRRGAWGNGQKEEGRKPSEQVVKSLALWERGLITPYALGAPAVRLRRMAEGHGRMPDSKALFRKSVERQQREFYTGIVRSHVVREMAGQAERRLGRELTPSEYQALQDYGDSLDGVRLVSYASGSDARLYEETAALVLRLPADAAGGTGNEVRESSSLETNVPEDNAGAAEEGKPKGEEVSEEMVRLLSELPDFISRAVVQELYAERAGNAIEPAPFRHGPGQGFYADSTGNAEKGTKEPEPYGPGLVYRTESQDSLRLSKLWEQSTEEEKERLLERIPLAVR